MTIKAQYTLACLSLLVLNVSCSGKSDSKAPVKDKVATAATPAPNTIPLKEVADRQEPKAFSEKSAASEKAAEGKALEANVSEAAPVVIKKADQSVETNAAPALNAKASDDAPKTPVIVSSDIAADSEEIKKSAAVKITFTNLIGLAEIMQSADAVIHDQQVASGAELSAKFKGMNEENFCRLDFKGTFHPQDYLKLVKAERKVLDQENDVYQDQSLFKNENGEVLVSCTHAGKEFLAEQFQFNMQNWITMFDNQGQKIDLASFRDERKQNRVMGSLKILNVEKLEQIIAGEGQSKFSALYQSKIVSLQAGFKDVALGNGKLACYIDHAEKRLSDKKVYVLVETGVYKETSKDMKTGMVYSIYRDDQDNFFRMSCLMQKTTFWHDLVADSNGILEFGVMDRMTYAKEHGKYKEAHDKFMATLK